MENVCRGDTKPLERCGGKAMVGGRATERAPNVHDEKPDNFARSGRKSARGTLALALYTIQETVLSTDGGALGYLSGTRFKGRYASNRVAPEKTYNGQPLTRR